MTTKRRTYIGDGVYAEFDGFGIWLTTERHDEGVHRIYLEPEIYRNFVAFAAACWGTV
jgi:hypothetical protein